MKVDWCWQNVVDCLYKETQFLWFHELKLTPCNGSGFVFFLFFCFFSTLSIGPCALFPLFYSCSNTPDFLQMMNFFRNYFSLVYCGFLVPTLPFCHCANYSFYLKGRFCFLYGYFCLSFPTGYYGRLDVLH